MRLAQDTAGWTVATDYDDVRGRALVKDAGFRWEPTRKLWATASATVAAELLATLRASDDVADDVADAIGKAVADEGAQAAEAVVASRAMDCNIDIPAPEGLSYLPYQKAGIAFLRERLANEGSGALLADEMGLGKTIQIIGYANMLLSEESHHRLRVLVIAPKIALLNWKAELEKWLIRPHSIAIWTTKAQPDADIVLVNYDIVAKLHGRIADKARPWGLLACDESHALKDSKAQRTKAVLGGKDMMPIPARRRVFVTGTPILNRPIELFPVLRSCGVEFARNYHSFARRYCNGQDTRFGFDASGASNLSELQEKLRASIMVRRLKADVLTDLPDKRRQVITIDPGESVALRKALRDEAGGLKQTEKAEAEAMKAVARAQKGADKAAYDEAIKRLSSIRVQNLAAIAELRQKTALAKVPLVVESVTATLDSAPDAVLVFAHHREVIDRLAEGFRAAGHEPAIITGETSAEDRKQAQDDIQNGRKRVFIGSIHACGVAITLTAASTVVFAELDWTPGRMVQAEDRAHRIGQKNAVLAQYLVVDGSIDADMLKTSWTKAFNAMAALDEVEEDGQDVSVTESVTETPRIQIEPPTLDPVETLEEPKAICVTESVTENLVTDEPVQPRRGRPPLPSGAMTPAERARRYRKARATERTIRLPAAVAERLAQIADEVGDTLDHVLARALDALERERQTAGPS